MFVYVEYNYSNQGGYNAYVTAYNENYYDNETIPFTGNEFITNYIYDNNGNLIQDSNYYYIYNKFNQLEKIKDSTNTSIISEYFYDHENNRVMKITSNENTYYPDDNLIKVKNTTGGFFTVYYKHDDTLVARNETNQSKLFYYHPDHLGSTTLITNSSGGKQEETNYKPYGEVLIGGEDRYLFTGKEFDDESNLEYFGARYYSPSLSLFVEPDSIISDVYNPQSLNRYSYVLNNPYRYIDQEGDFPVDVVVDVGTEREKFK